jgi:hypothetical protein
MNRPSHLASGATGLLLPCGLSFHFDLASPQTKNNAALTAKTIHDVARLNIASLLDMSCLCPNSTIPSLAADKSEALAQRIQASRSTVAPC